MNIENRFLSPTKSGVFLNAIKDCFPRLSTGCEEYYVGLVVIWMKARAGIHLKNSPHFMEFLQNSIPSLLERLPSDADHARASLLSLIYTLWIDMENQGNSHVMTQLQLIRWFASCMENAKPTEFFVFLLELSYF